MCRSIKTLRTEAVVTDEDTRAAALQYVRKISGYRKPSKANEAVFEAAVDQITAATDRLLAGVRGPGRGSVDVSPSPTRVDVHETQRA